MPVGVLAVMALFYIFLMLLVGILSLVFFIQPMIRHYAQETTIHNVAHLNTITQRDADDMIEAEGFADALDIGAAI